MTLKKNLGLALGGLAFLPLALAAPPDAGQLLNEQQRSKPSQQPVRDPALSATAEAPANVGQAAGFRARIERVRFSGLAGQLPDAKLQALVRDKLGQDLSHAELQALADRITAGLQAEGYVLARAYLPRQDLSAGELEIALIFGRLQDGAQRVEIHASDEQLKPRLRAIADASLPEGAVRGEQLERALLLLNDVPGVTARGALDKGQQPGTSRLIIKIEEERPWGLSAQLDNFNNRYTGQWRAGVQGYVNRPLQHEDVLGFSLNHSSGTDQAALNYGFALTPAGLRATVSASALRYTVGEELSPLELSGSARSVGGGLSFPLLRSRERNLWVALDAERKALSDEALGQSLRERRVNRLSASVNGNAWDGWLGGGQTELNLSATVGELNLARNAVDAQADALSARTQGGFSKLSWRVARTQGLDGFPQWGLFATLSGQQASRNLDSSEKFMLGGPSGVRAYAIGEASGDSGWLGSVELRRDFSAFAGLRGQWLAFADHGEITQHQQLWTGALPAGQRNGYGLSGVGLGLNLYGERWSLRSAWAHAVGSNPGISSAGLQADGLKDRQRLWVQASLRF